MNELVNLIYSEGDPILTAVKLVLVIACLELFAVACSYLGGMK
jgi:hypothetical protein